MEVEKVKRYLESSATIDGDKLPLRFFQRLIMHGLRVELIETNRVVCSFKVTPRLLEDIEIEAKALHVGKAVAVLSVEFRKKSTGKIIAQGRHTKYLPLPSKM
ncbi:hypothetical protein ERO13_D12G002100v2 [Gossypium hirsutum]|nr:hypothetical protein ERO13_D12G002100v2 [Gossypium hirsutum]